MSDYWTHYQRRRWMKANAAAWMRPDAAHWLMPNQAIWQGPKRYERKYSPDQPRDEQGRWTSGAGNGSTEGVQVAGTVIPVCIASGISLFTVGGVKSFSVTYDCAGGQTFTISGFGHKYDGIIPDPFRK